MGAKENKGPGMTAASIVLTVIAVVIFLVRSYSQRLVKRGFSLDELFLSAGLVSARCRKVRRSPNKPRFSLSVSVLRHAFVSYRRISLDNLTDEG